MLTKHTGTFEVKCDVCGAIETVHAHTHAEAWDIIMRRAWVIRKNGLPVIHICPECPDEGKKIAPSR